MFLAYLQTKAGCIRTPRVKPLREYIKEPQYTNSLLRELPEDFFCGAAIDCGAYDGETAVQFLQALPQLDEVYAFEPDAENFKKLAKCAALFPKIKPVERGVWSRTGRLHFSQSADSGSAITEADTGEDVAVAALDDIIPMGKRISFIKMDIEGSEGEALKGAAKIIARDMPMLAICAYHRRSDLIQLPRLITSLANENKKYQYLFYLRQHFYCVAVGELVLYAIPLLKNTI